MAGGAIQALGQSVHPQQISQIGGIADVVFHPPVPKSPDSQRVCQMHARSRRLQRVDRPVPAIRRFQDHLGVRAGPFDLQPQRHRVVDDAHRRKLLPGFRLPYDHRPPPMQINPDELPAVNTRS